MIFKESFIYCLWAVFCIKKAFTVTSGLEFGKGKFEIPESVTIDGKTYPVTGIGQDAFKYCNELTELCIPKTVKNIPLRLIDCEHLERFSVAEGNETYKSVDGVLFSADGMTLHIYPCAKADEEYIIPEGVTSIGSFSGSI